MQQDRRTFVEAIIVHPFAGGAWDSDHCGGQLYVVFPPGRHKAALGKWDCPSTAMYKTCLIMMSGKCALD